MIQTIVDPVLSKIPSIQHAFFTRQGGVSGQHYASLNCAYTCKDHPDNVRENKRRAMAHLGCTLNSLATVNNVHSNKVIVVAHAWNEMAVPDADAMVTNQPKIVLGADSADCPIILFADENAGVVGLAHAGWKGAQSGIIEETIKEMIELGAKPENICAAIGPCILQDSYEVDSNFYQGFLNESASNQVYFKQSENPARFKFDLLAYVKDKLNRLHLKSVTATNLDTYSDENRFFSYRRSLHKKEPDFGGHLSCIYLNK